MGPVVIIKLSALGDVVRAVPHMEAICAHHKGQTVWLLTQEAYAGLFAGHPSIKVHTFDRKKWWGPTSARGAAAWLAGLGAEVLYDLQGNRTSRKLVAKSRAKVKVGPDPGSVYGVHPKKSYDFSAPFQPNFADAMDTVLAAAGIGASKKLAGLFVPEKDGQFVARWMEEKGLSPGGFACLHAGSAADFPSKRWPEENFAALARLIGEHNKTVVWLGAFEDREVNARLSRQAGIDATGVFSPLQVFALARHACFAVTADSGPMYLAAAAGIPVFAFFGPTSAQRCAVRGQERRVLSNKVECSPCDKKKCPPEKGHACLAGISPQQVMEKILADPATGLHKG